MNLQEMSDIKELKALAFDQMMILEQTQRNLQLINQRLAELQESASDIPKKK